jgi:hypothetical protein
MDDKFIYDVSEEEGRRRRWLMIVDKVKIQ